ncbi:MAG TPA: LacI family DNA-binding transcriptional regulator [Verrucomicrobium sp.]|nr:LacI family DNA-binding transcriptional regulator [Verrucomicrobium sp.]
MFESRVRMDDVARAAGVSVATVSRALKDDTRITPLIRDRVKAAAIELGYVPNPLVQSLMSQRRTGRESQVRETIALVTNYPHDAWPQKDVCRWYYRGIQERAQQLGYGVEVFSLEALHHDPDRLGQVLRARSIRAALLGFSRDVEQPVVFDVSGLCVVGLSTYFRDLPVDRVHLNGFYNIKLACRHLRSQGYRRPGLIVPVANNLIVGGQWTAAALDEQWQRPEDERCPPFMVEGSHVNMIAFRTWFETHQPDALIAYKVPVVELLDRLRLRVPQDVGVAALFGTEQERKTMAGIDGNLERVGAAAVDLLVQKLQVNERGLPQQIREVLISGTWQDGPSVVDVL